VKKLKEYLDELEFLTFGRWTSSQTFFAKNGTTKSQTFVGTGKIEEIHQYVKREISTLIFDDELSPSQQKNISKVIVECKILDRTHLILDILHKEQRHRMPEPK
jgi:GTP-binding protein HflX